MMLYKTYKLIILDCVSCRIYAEFVSDCIGETAITTGWKYENEKDTQRKGIIILYSPPGKYLSVAGDLWFHLNLYK